MKTLNLALTEKRKISCDGYIYPADLFDIPEIEGYRDLKRIKEYAKEKLAAWSDCRCRVYVNGGLAVELLSLLQAAKELKIELELLHYDLCTGLYCSQELKWKPCDSSEKSDLPEMVLCEGRHCIKTAESIYKELPEDKILDFQWLEKEARKKLQPYQGKTVRIYLTGLSPLYCCVLNVASELGINVIFLHYDYDEEEYFEQPMVAG